MNNNLETARDLLDQASEYISDAKWVEQFKQLLQTPSNEYQSPRSRELIKKLYLLQGKTILTGQHDYIESPYSYSSKILGLTGYNTMIKGVEFGGITGQDAATLFKQRQGIVDACKAWDAKDGIVSATYHASYPGLLNTWSNVQRATTQAEFDQIITPGNNFYKALIDDLDILANHLSVLRDNDIPVLWRPYHEMNGGWFWWGKKNNFKALWNIMYDRFVNVHGLDNLIWVWCPNAKNAWCDDIENYYVGTSKADVLALDIYNNDFKQEHHDSLLKLGKGKLIAIGENGELPSISKLITTQNKYSWFMTWGSMLNENNKDDVIKEVYGNSYTLKRGQEYSPFGDGLKGEYFDGVNFNTLKLTRIDNNINFNWGGNKPVDSLKADNFSIRWSGYILPKYSEQYKFIIHSDDGARLIINNVIVAERWKNGDSWISGIVDLVAGVKYPITVEYYDSTGAAVIDLIWSSASQVSQLIPKEQLYSK